ncbi:MAG: quinolinate synthase NadA [Clostridiales bacterium]|nr:quinolinate synthase NadA [Clostridiales bacterium]
MTVKDKIQSLKEKNNAIILAHYYVPAEVQEIADYVGDSFYLSKVATGTDADILVLCGVSFMGESAKILNPDKTVLMPDPDADCPMAHMADAERIRRLREEYEDLAVVCYINSTAELKTLSDVCVTSANALKIVKALPNKNILFIPDENLGQYVASKLPEKNFIFNDGRCPIHAQLKAETLAEAKKAHPKALVLIHPECTPDTLALADYIGSTSGIIDFATESSEKEFIICTEDGVMYELQRKNPDKTFYMVHDEFQCPGMKQITLDKVLDVLENKTNQINVDDKLRADSLAPLQKMLELGK